MKYLFSKAEKTNSMNKLLELKSLKVQNRKGEIWVLEKNLALLVKSHIFHSLDTFNAEEHWNWLTAQNLQLYGNYTATNDWVQ